MQVYLVGGAVRDTLLGKKAREHDYVVVNETPENMLKKGFKQVGKDFPVFLHPKTHEEYALARKERKTDTGYHGFAMDIDHVTLEEDLLRRDLTINAIAKDPDGTLIDPYGGQSDLNKKILRHVSKAFIEDPLRVLRVARFQAMLPEFTIHPNTFELMKELCSKPEEILSLPKERLWKEVEKASAFPDFHLFWKVLDECGALNILELSINDNFLSQLQESKAVDTFKLVSGLWSHPTPRAFLSLNPPSNIADAIHLIDSERKTLLEPTSDAEVLLKTLHRLDPFRRKDRALRILQTLSDPSLIKYWEELIQAVTTVGISEIIKQPNKQSISKDIAQARLNAIKHLLENK